MDKNNAILALKIGAVILAAVIGGGVTSMELLDDATTRCDRAEGQIESLRSDVNALKRSAKIAAALENVEGATGSAGSSDGTHGSEEPTG